MKTPPSISRSFAHQQNDSAHFSRERACFAARRAGLRGPAVSVARELADAAGPDGRVRMTVDDMCRLCCYARGAMLRARRELIASGLVSADERDSHHLQWSADRVHEIILSAVNVAAPTIRTALLSPAPAVELQTVVEAWIDGYSEAFKLRHGRAFRPPIDELVRAWIVRTSNEAARNNKTNAEQIARIAGGAYVRVDNGARAIAQEHPCTLPFLKQAEHQIASAVQVALDGERRRARARRQEPKTTPPPIDPIQFAQGAREALRAVGGAR